MGGHVKEISNSIVYRAKVSNGVILESSTFKSLWKRALSELDDFYGDSLYFETGTAQFSYGVLTTVVYDGDCSRTSYIKMDDLGELRVFSMDHVTNRLYKNGGREYVL